MKQKRFFTVVKILHNNMAVGGQLKTSYYVVQSAIKAAGPLWLTIAKDMRVSSGGDKYLYKWHAVLVKWALHFCCPYLRPLRVTKHKSDPYARH